MASKYKDRKLQAFSLDRFSNGQPGQYDSITSDLRRIKASQRVVESRSKAIAIPRVETWGRGLRFRVLSGEPGLAPLLLDLDTAEDSAVEMSEREVSAQVVHVLLDIRSRITVVEYNKSGVKYQEIGSVLEELLKRATNFQDTVIQLSPLPDKSWSKRVDEFERVSLASVRLLRPNPGWDDYPDVLAEIGGDSDGRRVDVEVAAERSESLSKTKGIVRFIKGLGSRVKGSIAEARIVGRRRGEAVNDEIRLTKNVAHRRVRVPLTPEGQIRSADIYSAMEQFAAEVGE